MNRKLYEELMKEIKKKDRKKKFFVKVDYEPNPTYGFDQESYFKEITNNHVVRRDVK